MVGRRHRPGLMPALQTDMKDITLLSLTRKDQTHLSFSVVGSPLRFEEFLRAFEQVVVQSFLFLVLETHLL